MTSILCHGRHETLKASVHAATLGLAAVCTAYNFAAWMARRQRHSWVNSVLYATLAVWECTHVRHHLNCRKARVTHTRPEQHAA